jgi:hypothetical protein
VRRAGAEVRRAVWILILAVVREVGEKGRMGVVSNWVGAGVGAGACGGRKVPGGTVTSRGKWSRVPPMDGVDSLVGKGVLCKGLRVRISSIRL